MVPFFALLELRTDEGLRSLLESRIPPTLAVGVDQMTVNQ